MTNSSHEPLVTQVAVQMDVTTSTSSPSSSSTTSVMLPSSYHMKHLLMSYIIPIIFTIILAVVAHDAIIFFAPMMVLIAVLFWMYLFVGWLRRGGSILSVNGSNPSVDMMSTQKLLSLLLAHFTYGFWVSGSVECIFSIVGLLIFPSSLYAVMDPWFSLFPITIIHLAVIYWGIIYFYSLRHVKLATHAHIDRGISITTTYLHQQAISVTALTMGCITAQLWYGFTVAAYHMDWFQPAIRVTMPSDIVQQPAWLILVALIISMTLLPLDMRGAEHIVLGATAQYISGTVAITIHHDGVSPSAIPYRVFGIDFLGVPVLLRFVCLYGGCFGCLIGMWNVMNQPYVAILVYVIIASLICYMQTRAGNFMRTAILQRCHTSQQPQPLQQI